jgi:hypothetical protein
MFHSKEGLLPMLSPHLRAVGPKIRGGRAEEKAFPKISQLHIIICVYNRQLSAQILPTSKPKKLPHQKCKEAITK